MHDVTACDFSVSYPCYKKIKPVPGRRLSITYTRELVNSIVNSVDRFYKPTIPCRRHFNVYSPFVSKYYPDCLTHLRKQTSFLHKDPNSCTRNNRRYKKSISLYEFSSNNNFHNICDFRDYHKIIQICHEFLITERFLCDLQKGYLFDSCDRKSISKYMYWLNLRNANKSVVEERPKRTGMGFRKSYRKSFPLLSSMSFAVSEEVNY